MAGSERATAPARRRPAAPDAARDHRNSAAEFQPPARRHYADDAAAAPAGRDPGGRAAAAAAYPGVDLPLRRVRHDRPARRDLDVPLRLHNPGFWPCRDRVECDDPRILRRILSRPNRAEPSRRSGRGRTAARHHDRARRPAIGARRAAEPSVHARPRALDHRLRADLGGGLPARDDARARHAGASDHARHRERDRRGALAADAAGFQAGGDAARVPDRPGHVRTRRRRP